VTNLDTGILGAKRQSWHEESPRDLLRKLLKENPRATEAELLAIFEEVVRSSKIDYISPIIEYWFANNYRSLIKHKRKRPPAKREDIERAKAKLRAQISKIAVMDLPLPHGKTLGKSTGAECAVLGPRIGKWLTAIAEKVGPKSIVDETLTEEQVRTLYVEAV
jgi:hypothetical protein